MTQGPRPADRGRETENGPPNLQRFFRRRASLATLAQQLEATREMLSRLNRVEIQWVTKADAGLVDLSGQYWLVDLRPLAGLPLRELRLGGTGVRSLEPLRKMQQLSKLALNNCAHLTSLSPISQLPLLSLDVRGCTRLRDRDEVIRRIKTVQELLR